jgi:hypothetical protein
METDVMSNLVDVLSSQPEPLFAVLDAARALRARELILLSKEKYTSLYREEATPELEFFAPYLVHLPPHCKLLQQFVAEGWGQSWGVFLTCDQPLESVQHQLRRSLMVRLEGQPKLVYFRFYDPRVLRTFLPIASDTQVKEFFGPITAFLVEDQKPDALLRFSFPDGRGTERIGVQVPAIT